MINAITIGFHFRINDIILTNRKFPYNLLKRFKKIYKLCYPPHEKCKNANCEKLHLLTAINCGGGNPCAAISLAIKMAQNNETTNFILKKIEHFSQNLGKKIVRVFIFGGLNL